MKTATAKQIKDDLKHKDRDELLQIVQRLARFKKENKELLTYLLFEADHEEGYVETMKAYIDEQFLAVNTRNHYYVKKNVRKILKETKKYIRYSGNKETEIQLLIHFCKMLFELQPYYSRIKILRDIFERQVILIKTRISTLHEDLQYDYEQELYDIGY